MGFWRTPCESIDFKILNTSRSPRGLFLSPFFYMYETFFCKKSIFIIPKNLKNAKKKIFLEVQDQTNITPTSNFLHRYHLEPILIKTIHLIPRSHPRQVFFLTLFPGPNYGKMPIYTYTCLYTHTHLPIPIHAHTRLYI